MQVSTIRETKQFIKERDEAILSMNKEKIIVFFKKWNVQIPENDEVFWRAVHKVAYASQSATREQKERSAKWLSEHNSSVLIIRENEC